MERLTSQKKIILDYLKNVKTHPSAEKIYLEAKKKLPQISQGTVYRILNQAKEKGEIKELPCKICSRFDGDISQHAHFICEKCGDIYDIFEKIKIPSEKKVEKIGKINNYQLCFYGICKKCQK
mgnify:CR=1 FL=1